MTGAGGGGSRPRPQSPAGTSPWRWLWDHAGRLTGIVLGLVAFAFLVLLASLGWPPAYGLVVLVVIVVAMIALGGRIKGS